MGSSRALGLQSQPILAGGIAPVCLHTLRGLKIIWDRIEICINTNFRLYAGHAE